MDFPRIRDLREDSDLSQEALASTLNISARTYSHYGKRDRNIPVQVVMELAKFHKTSTDCLLGLSDKR
ncbi:helix-turn-helix domain-containing protein [Clostridia bacterium OttesenSCG-928-O13]|nr:helix-turn-helix domain-containing protein [Clostridia bacterium OttesenSCG-928-O13]